MAQVSGHRIHCVVSLRVILTFMLTKSLAPYSRNLGKCTATFACAYIMLYLFERKLAEIDMESIQKHEEDLHFPGIFLPLPHFEVLTQPKGFPRNGPVWERYTRFVEDESRRQAANGMLS